MYKWRGDLGLLDRLSYGNSREIPRNWEMTSLDAARIDARYQAAQLSLQWHPTNLISDRPYTANENGRENNIIDPQPGLSHLPPNYVSSSLPTPVKKKRYASIIGVTYWDRTRIDKKKREKGNNRFGRKGNLRCFQCRKRKIKVRISY